jgi:hypothetical protein
MARNRSCAHDIASKRIKTRALTQTDHFHIPAIFTAFSRGFDSANVCLRSGQTASARWTFERHKTELFVSELCQVHPRALAALYVCSVCMYVFMYVCMCLCMLGLFFLFIEAAFMLDDILHIYIYIYICIYTHIYTYIHIYLSIYLSIYYICTYTHIHTHTHIIHTHTRIYIYIYIYIYLYAYKHKYIHTFFSFMTLPLTSIHTYMHTYICIHI